MKPLSPEGREDVLLMMMKSKSVSVVVSLAR